MKTRKLYSVRVIITCCTKVDAQRGKDLDVTIRIPVKDESGQLRSLADIKELAVERAIQKKFGRRCFWFEDSGLRGYGQVFKSLGGHNGASSVTNRCGLDVAIL